MIATSGRCTHCTHGQLVIGYDEVSHCHIASCLQCGCIACYRDVDGHIIRGGRAPNKGELLSIAHHNGRGR